MPGRVSAATVSGVRARPPPDPSITRRPPCSKAPSTHPSPNLECRHSVQSSTVSPGDHCPCSCPEITVTRQDKLVHAVSQCPFAQRPAVLPPRLAWKPHCSPDLQGPSPSDVCSDHVPTCYQVLVTDMRPAGSCLGLCVGTPIFRRALRRAIGYVLPLLRCPRVYLTGEASFGKLTLRGSSS